VAPIKIDAMLAIPRGANPVVRKAAGISPAQIGVVLAIGLLARVAVLWFAIKQLSAQWFFHRGMEMGFLAQSIIQGKGLSSPFGGSTGPTAFVAPGYPLIIAAVFAIFGAYSTASALIIMAAQAGLNLLTILLIMHFTARLANAQMAVLAGLFWALSPPLIWLPTIFWDTSFTCFIVIASVVWAQRIEHNPSPAGFAVSGALTALAGLINPALLPALIVMMCWVAYRCRKSNPYGLLVASLTLIVTFSPWPIRNAHVFHAFIPLRSTVGFELWMGNRPQSKGFLDESVFPTFNASEFQHYVSAGEVVYVREKSAEAQHYISSHRLNFAVLSMRRAWRFWTGSGTLGGSPIFVAHACATSVLGLFGLAMLARRRLSLAALSLLPLLVFPLPYYITHAEFRYRLAIDPLLIVLSAYTLSRLFGRRGEL
jgi:hypothetical protein